MDPDCDQGSSAVVPCAHTLQASHDLTEVVVPEILLTGVTFLLFLGVVK